jgi:hypothetical protein
MRLTIIALLVLVQSAPAAFEKMTNGGRANGMGGVIAGTSGDPWGALDNPASLPTMADRTLAFYYTPGMMGLTELSRTSVAFVEPFQTGGIAFSASRFGFDLYREVTAAISLGIAPMKDFRFGVTIHYCHLTIRDYGSAGTLKLDAGVQIAVTGEMVYAFCVSNLNAGTIGSTKERLPQVFSTGIMYHPVPGACIGLDIVKDIAFPANLRLGVEYIMVALVALRAGVSSEPSGVSGGIGLVTSLFQLDYAISSHPDLGMSHHLSLAVNFGGL